MDESGKASQKNFSVTAPESDRLGRTSDTGLPASQPGRSELEAMTGAELRLYLWSGLPERHRNEVCRQIRMRCETFISSLRVDRSQRRSEIDRLVSEVVAHLLRATSLRKDETAMPGDLAKMQSAAEAETGRARAATTVPAQPLPWLARGRLDEYEPIKDSRVIWAVEETCNRQALFHRYEDLRRRDRGGKWDGTGYPLVPVDDQTIEQLSGHYDPANDETDSLHAADSRRAWDGLVQLVMHQFGPNDDVVALVRVLAEDRETQDAFGSQWPIAKIASALNQRQPDKPWNDDRVDNAKKRLTKCIAKIRKAHGLDAVDLRALLARYARHPPAAAGHAAG